MKDPLLCTVYDQITDRSCRYYIGHGGSHNFARLDHNYYLERALRCELDTMTKARDEACDIAAMAGHKLKRIAELRKVGAP